jgi:uncharacterized OB-fold protein
MQVPRHWREMPARYRMEAGRCRSCHAIAFPRRLLCPNCGGRDAETMSLSGKGKLLTHTVIRVAPEGFEDQVPYAVGIVELDEGIRVMGQITDCDPETLAIGDRMTSQFRRMREEGPTGIIMYSYKFVPDVGL